jgi:hypothetical protein
VVIWAGRIVFETKKAPADAVAIARANMGEFTRRGKGGKRINLD